MPVSVTMPALGESVTEGTITQWLKKEGDTVEVDEPLLEVSTDKVDTEIPSPSAGVLTRIVAGEDETVDVGGELAVIGESGEDTGAAPAAEAPAAEPQAQPEPEPAAPAQSAPAAEPAAQPAAQQPAATGTSGTDVAMPALGESVTEGTITQWLKAVGDTIEVDEALVEVSTDKVDTEIPSPVAGTLLEIKVGEDETAEVGATLAVVGSGDAAATPPESPPSAPEPAAEPEPKPEPQAAAAQPAPPQQSEPASTPSQAKPQPSPTASTPEGVYVTPLVRKLATDKNVDLAKVSGTGVGGRIRKQDVLAAAEAAQPAAPADNGVTAAPTPTRAEPSPLRGRTEKMTRLRKVIATNMMNALHSQAQLTTVLEVDVTKVAQLRTSVKDDFQARHGVKLSFLPFFAMATVEALQQYPQVNSTVDMDAGTITYPEAENLGMAVDTPKGLIVPVIHNAGDLNLAGLAKRIADIAERTRNNKLKPDDIAGATFTLTNTGSRGALFDTPIVNAPQSGMLGTGAVVKRPVVINDPDLGEVVVPRSMMYLALSYDHRVIDGADASRYLTAIKERLEEGNFEGQLGL